MKNNYKIGCIKKTSKDIQLDAHELMNNCAHNFKTVFALKRKKALMIKEVK